MTNASGADAPAMPIDRRAAIRSMFAAGATLAIPAAAVAASLDVDPVFAAIERHKASRDRFGEAVNLTDEVRAQNEGRTITEADEAEYEAASDAEGRDLIALTSTPPQTKAGMRAMLDYVLSGTFYEELPEGGLETLFDALLRSPLIAGEA